MALKSLSFMMIMVAAGASLDGASAFLGGRKAMAPAPGPVPDAEFGFIPLDRESHNVIALATFVIDQHNKASKSNLVFTAVLEAVQNNGVNGIYYGLVIAATNEQKQLNDYEATVLVENDKAKVVVFRPDQ